jgi:DNA-binding NarL/FixJ family response regulator
MPPKVVHLTPCQAAIVLYLVAGYRDESIAFRLGLHVDTATRRVADARKKVDVATRVELAVWGHR